MPIYEYRCDNGHTFEAMQRMADDPLTACQVCDAPVQKILHAPAVHFKGSGFYTTDYGKKKVAGASADAKKNGSGPSDSSSGTDSTSSDSSSGSDSGSSKGSDASKKTASKSD